MGTVASKLFTESTASAGAIANFINANAGSVANPNFAIFPRGSGGVEVIVATS